MKRYAYILPFLPLFLMVASCEEAEEAGPVTVLEEEPGLLAQAAISPDSAVGLALARVPGTHIRKAEIEHEAGRLIYTFDMARGGEEGEEAEGAEEMEEAEEGGEGVGMITEVHVDAITGEIVSVEHEGGGETEAPGGI